LFSNLFVSILLIKDLLTKNLLIDLQINLNKLSINKNC